jgi:leader peptidase (prepilin peptidase) / N-methyltransferase
MMDIDAAWLILMLLGAAMGVVLAEAAKHFAQTGRLWPDFATLSQPSAGATHIVRPHAARLAAALAGAAIAVSAGLISSSALHLTLLLGAGWLLLLASLIDAHCQLLPRPLNIVFGALGIAEPYVGFNSDPPSLADRLLGALIAFAALMLVKHLYARLRHRDGLGLGDISLCAALACWLGWQALPWLLLSAALAALIGTIALLAIRQANITNIRHQRLAFGPWLAAAGWVLVVAQRV